MIVSFKDEGTRDIFLESDTRAARQICPSTLWHIARRRLESLDRAVSLSDLTIPQGNRLERLKGDRAGQHSIRINRKYRICFWWIGAGPEHVEIVDYH
jgi:toxin HigB-1